MPNAEPRYSDVLRAQTRLHGWALGVARDRADQFHAAREAGVTAQQIAVITGWPLEDVLDVLGEREKAAAGRSGLNWA
jgi:hypothetical protein